MYQKFFIALQYLLPQIWLTQLMSYIANLSRPRWLKNRLIFWAVRHYKIDVSLAAETTLTKYKTFNDFFIRRLRPTVRPLAIEGIISPVDGLLTQIGSIDKDNLIQAKNIFYSLDCLLAKTPALAATFQQGYFTTFYLAPKDYHRVHMPLRGTLLQTIYVPGSLFSVNQLTAENVTKLFARNERLICEFKTELGNMVMIFVGALFVAGIHTLWAGDIKRCKQSITTDYRAQNIVLERGAEAGYFKFGSSVILLFPQGSIVWEKSLYPGKTMLMGQNLAQQVLNKP